MRSLATAAAGVLLLGAGLAACSSSSPHALGPLAVTERAHGGSFTAGSGGAAFDMRGFNYQPLVKVQVDGKPAYQNDTFAPSYYRQARVVTTLSAMQAEGYNTVRVFLSPHQIGNPGGPGLDPSYMANVADFLTEAHRHGIYTLITIGELPTSGDFIPPNDPSFGLWNEDYLDPADITAEKRYLTDLVVDLRNRHAPLADALWELKGEQDWDNYAAPLDWTSGTVRVADGGTYDMAVAASRAAMETQSLLYWTNALTSTLHALVPGTLVGVGVYAPSVKRPKWTVRPGVLFTKAAGNSFVDVHVYPNLGSERVQMASFHASATTKPVIMGEFGATEAEGSLKEAAKTLVSWQEQSCSIAGLSVSGWLLWTWNSSAQSMFWDALQGGGVLEHALAPITRPNPCK